MEKFDVAVIGSGPGGYVAAIRAAQNGLKVACIEKEKTLGGTCLNIGCIPSKSLLHSTEYFHRITSQGKEHGIEYSDLKVNLEQMMKRKENVVSSLVQGVSFLFKKNKITSFQGEAKLTSPTTISFGKENIEANSIILATGSEPISLPFLPFDEKRIVSSTGALSLPSVPKKLAIIGAGIIGLELGSVYRRLGSDVDVIELLDRPTPTLDHDLSKGILQVLQKQGMHFHFNTKVTDAKIGTNISLTLENGEPIPADVVLVAIGRRPYSKNLGLEQLGIQTNGQKRVIVDVSFRTSISSIFAIGDLIEGPMLAHKASEEGIAVADFIAGKGESQINYLAIPNVMYTWPEVASVGMTESEAKEAGLELVIGKLPFKAVARARCSGDDEGFLKLIGEKNSDRLIGMHLLGPSVSEMIHEGVLAIRNKLTLSEIAEASHAHPTCSEGIKEAALAAKKMTINF